MEESERIQTLLSNLVEGIRQEHKWPFRSRARRKVPTRGYEIIRVQLSVQGSGNTHGRDRPPKLAQILRGKTRTQNSESTVC